MNLTTARSSGRLKEIGVRKTIGALQKHLILQFLFESFFVTFIAGSDRGFWFYAEPSRIVRSCRRSSKGLSITPPTISGTLMRGNFAG